MKHFLQAMLMCIALAVYGLPAIADDYTWTDSKGAKYECITVGGKYQTETVDGYTSYHVKITQAEPGVKDLVVYNDIGSVYNYRTIFIDHNAFQGNQDLQTVTFEDTYSNTAKVHSVMDMSLGDYVFKGCTNLRAIYMKYNVTTNGVDGHNHTVMLKPDVVRPEGKGIFDDCPNLKIYVDAQYYDDYCQDKWWSQYKDKLVPTTEMRYSTWSIDGTKYDYDRTKNATYDPITETSAIDGRTTVWPIHATGADDSYLKSNNGKAWLTADIGQAHAYRTTSVWAKAFYANANLKRMGIAALNTGATTEYSDIDSALGDSAFAHCPQFESIDIVKFRKQGDESFDAITPQNIKIGRGVFADDDRLYIRVHPDQVEAFRQADGWKDMAGRIIPYTNYGDSYKGVKYAYIYKPGSTSDYYTNNDNDALSDDALSRLRQQTTSQSFDADALLVSPSSASNVRYKIIGGLNDSDIDQNDGQMTIVNDFGATYNYRTIAIDAHALRGNSHIKSVSFQDLADNYASSSHYELRMAIPDGAFQGCQNLKTLSMYYLVLDGDNHYEALGPENIFIGKDVFDQCDPDFEIRVAPDRLAEFLADPDWARYKDHIHPWEFAPTTYSAIEQDGVTYDYAATQMNNLPNDKVVKSSYSLLNIPIQAVSVAVSSIETLGTNLALGFVKPTFDAMLQSWIRSTIVSIGFSYTTMMLANLGYDESLMSLINIPAKIIVSSGISGIQKGSWWTFFKGMRNRSYITLCKKLRSTAEKGAQRRLESTVDLLDTKGLDMRALEDENLDKLAGDDYPGDTYLAKALNMWSQFKTKNTYVVYKMYISKVGDLSGQNGQMRIYNDIGTVYNYRTITMDASAARNNTTIKTVTFQDVYKGSPHTTFLMTLPDRAFEGCTNLERFEMFMQSKDQNRRMALGPMNVLPLGSHIFDNCPNLKIYVAKEKYAEFAADSLWSQYKNRIVAEDWEEKTDFNECGAYYAYNMNSNSLVDKRGSVWYTHIVKPDDSYLAKNDGQLTIVNDPGTTYDYHTTYVKANAFRGNRQIKSVAFRDLITSNPTATAGEKTFSLALNDSCFADCPNLKAIYMTYKIKESYTHDLPLGPENVSLGQGVFAGHADDFKIYVDFDKMEDFLLSPTWGEYAEYIVPCYFDPKDANVRFALDGSPVDSYASVLGTPTKSASNPAKAVKSFDEYEYWMAAGLTEVPDNQFSNWTSLQRITLPPTAKTIGNEAFSNTKLERLTLPASIERLGSYVWRNCSKLGIIRVEATTPPACTAQTFADGLTADYRIFVPDSLVDTYRMADGWSTVKSHIYGFGEQAKYEGPRKVEITTKQYGDLLSHFGMHYNIELDSHTDQTGTAINNYYLTVDGNTCLQWAYIDSLKVTGPLDAADLMLIARMGSGEGNLAWLDLSDATFVSHYFDYKGDKVIVMYPTGSIIDDGKEVLTAYSTGLMKKLKTLITPKHTGMAVSTSGLETLYVSECDNGQTCSTNDGNYPDIILFGKPAAGKFFSEKNSATIYVPYSSYGEYTSAKYYGQKAGAVKAPFKDDAAFVAMAKVGLYNDTQAALRDTLPPLLKGNTKLHTFDDFYIFSSLPTVADGFFSGCSALERVTIPISVRSIGRDAFRGCTSLRSLSVLTDTVPDLAGEDPDNDTCTALADLPADFRIYVTDNMLDKFLANAKWYKYRTHFATFQQTDNSVAVTTTAIGQLAEKLGMHQTVKGSEVTEISGGTCDISSIRKLKITGPISGADIAILRYLGGREYQDGLKVSGVQLREIDLADAQIVKSDVDYKRDGINRNVTADNVLDQEMFYDCDKLEKIVLPKTLTEIGRYALARCAKLNTIIVPENVSTIRGYAFEDSPRIKNLVFTGDKLPENIDTWAFGSEAGVLYDKHYLVDCIYTRKNLRKDVAAHPTLQQHTLHTAANFDDDGMFRSLAMHCVLDTASASLVENVDGWFGGNSALRDATMLRTFESLKSLPDRMFQGCTNLEKVVVPANVQSIGSNLFDADSKHLRLIDMQAVRNAGTAFSRTSGTFDGVAETTLVYLPTNNSEGAFDDTNVVNTTDDGAACKSLVLGETAEVEIPHPFTADKAAIARTFSKNVKATVFLPFAISEKEAAAMGSFYEFSGYDAATKTVNFRRVLATEPNTGYMFVPNTAGLQTSDEAHTAVAATKATTPDYDTDGFVGVYKPTTLRNPQNIYGYAGQTQGQFEEGQFVKVSDGAYVAPMRSYLMIRTAYNAPVALAAFFDNNGEPTGIVGVDNNDTSTIPDFVDIYAIDGTLIRRHVHSTECTKSLKEGIYIVNGKKITVK